MGHPGVHWICQLLPALHPKVQQDRRATHFDAQSKSMEVVVDDEAIGGGGGKSVKKSAKSKILKGRKICKGHRFGGTKLPDLRHYASLHKDEELEALPGSCKHEVLVLGNHKVLRRFRDTKSLSSRQVRWAQELSRCHFRIDSRQGKANGTAEARVRRKIFELNTRILHRRQFSLTNRHF